MKVSIIVATYNREHLIGRCIRSVQAQSYSDWELIIVDDGSVDNTEAVIEDFIERDSRIRYFRLPMNQGATVARNRGLEEACGEVMMVWDSDDELYPFALERVVKEFNNNSAVDIVSAVCAQKQNGELVPYKALATGELFVEQILCRILPSCTKIRVAKAEIFRQVSYEARNIDFTVNCYLAELGRWYHLDEELGLLHLESDAVSLTTSRRKPNIARSIERVEPLLRFFAQFGGRLKAHCPSRYAALAYGLALGLLLRGDTTLARSYAKEASQLDGLPLYRRLYLLSCLPGAGFVTRALYRFRKSIS